jgi:hypothetical protein
MSNIQYFSEEVVKEMRTGVRKDNGPQIKTFWGGQRRSVNYEAKAAFDAIDDVGGLDKPSTAPMR